MNAITTTPTSFLPAPMSPALSTAVALAMNKLDPEGIGFSISIEDAPSSEVREALVRRLSRLDGALLPIGERGAANQVMTLKLTLETKGRSDVEFEALLDLYVKNLADLPAFAVIAACEDYQKGRAGDGKWLPKVPELCSHVTGKLQPVVAERLRIDRVLKAKVRDPECDPERKARTVAIVQDLAASMRSEGAKAEAQRVGRVIEASAIPETPQAALERLRDASTRTPIAPLSPSLAAKTRHRLGLPEPAEWSAA